MTDQTKIVIQVTYTLQGSFEQGCRIERAEHGGLTIHERLACLFCDVRTLHKAIVAASMNASGAEPKEAELDASTVILQLVAKTLQNGVDSTRLELEGLDELEEVNGDPDGVVH
jgi:hypothetical protein